MAQKEKKRSLSQPARDKPERSSQKKRKRHSELPNGEAQTSSKKKQKTNESTVTVLDDGSQDARKIRITHFPPKGQQGPVLLHSSGIKLVEDISFQAFHKDDPDKPEILLHSSDHPRLNYTAREQLDGSTDDYLEHYIGVYDPGRKHLSLMQAKKMSATRSFRAEDAEMQAVRAQSNRATDPTPSKTSRRSDLGLEFGNKKMKKNISTRQQNTINTEPGRSENTAESRVAVSSSIAANPSQSAILNAVAVSSQGAPTRADVQAEADAAKPRPPHNPSATTLEDAYNVSDIVGQDILEKVKVKPWVDAVEAGESIQTSSIYASHRIQDLVFDHEIKKLKVIKYILLLMELWKAGKPGRDGGRKLEKRSTIMQNMTQYGVDEPLAAEIKDRFCNGGQMTSIQTTRLLLHICVLTLHIDENASDTFDLRRDLNIAPEALSSHYQDLGAKVAPMSERQRSLQGLGSKAEAHEHRVARIEKFPLEFPRQRRGAPAGGRR
ncbi:MAG: DNA-directed RNA polymerase I subunit rpa49 [Alyxoria varia]|nr:MAG: DNA-directed RNA polymerase I subunit rpa49 [Alyxoria varia]